MKTKGFFTINVESLDRLAVNFINEVERQASLVRSAVVDLVILREEQRCSARRLFGLLPPLENRLENNPDPTYEDIKEIIKQDSDEYSSCPFREIDRRRMKLIEQATIWSNNTKISGIDCEVLISVEALDGLTEPETRDMFNSVRWSVSLYKNYWYSDGRFHE